MTYNSTIGLDQISESQSGKATTANALFSAMSPAALFGIKTSATSGLQFGLYGGNMNIAGVPTAIASQTVTLTASATNYIYATAAGVVTKTTSAPTGWPGPITSPAGAIALYQLVVGTSGITSGVSYLLGTAAKGDTGLTGATGPAALDVAESRKRWWQPVGNGSSTVTVMGLAALTLTGTSLTTRTLASSSLRESIPYAAYLTAGSAGSSAQVHHQYDLWHLGSAAGRGGFTLGIRFCLESASSPANQRSFFGLMPAGTIGNVEPDTLLNIIGVGANAGEANFSIMHNDGSGTATKTLLEADGESPATYFPARATDNVYELTLDSVANSGIVSYSLLNCNTGDEATGTISSNLPANTLFLTVVAWVNNGSTASAAAMGLMQIAGESRY
jgi:hypothetical protein